MYDLLIKLRLLAEIILVIVCFYAAVELDFGTRLFNLVMYGVGVFAVFCTANTIDAIQKWGRHKDEDSSQD